eukprot:1037664-Pelagomonas_calceolata.AAC.2
MSITLKPGLLTSKLPPIVSLDQAVPGVKTHAVVTGVKDLPRISCSHHKASPQVRLHVSHTPCTRANVNQL